MSRYFGAQRMKRVLTIRSERKRTVKERELLAKMASGRSTLVPTV
jgi:hypothetical protein